MRFFLRYRKYDLGDGINLIVRCEHDAVTPGPSGENIFLNIKTLNEWDSKVSLHFCSVFHTAFVRCADIQIVNPVAKKRF